MLLANSDVSEITRKVDEAMLWIGGICVFFLVAITAAMVFFVVRYSRKRHPQPKQVEGNLRLEIVWVVIPTLLVLFMFFKGYEGFKLMRTVPEGAMTVEVVARSWSWTFLYPEHGIVSSGGEGLHVPVNRPTRLNLTSAEGDVLHSFYLPAFRVKEDCVPGRTNYMWIQPEKEGTYNVFCAEYCGRDHSKMMSHLEVHSQEGFQAWVERKIEEKNKPVDLAQAMDPNSEEIQKRDAEKLYLTYCASCHGPEGQGGLVEGARNFQSLEGWKRGPKVTDIYRTLTEGLEGTQMRAFDNIPPWDRFALSHYVAAFYSGTDRPESTPEDIAKLKEDYRLGEKQEKKARISIEKAMEIIAAEAVAEKGE